MDLPKLLNLTVAFQVAMHYPLDALDTLFQQNEGSMINPSFLKKEDLDEFSPKSRTR